MIFIGILTFLFTAINAEYTMRVGYKGNMMAYWFTRDLNCPQLWAYGRCDNWQKRWYWLALQKTCFPYFYTGCEPSGNSWMTKAECMLNCQGITVVEPLHPRTIMPQFSMERLFELDDDSIRSRCYTDHSFGWPCSHVLIRYYFDYKQNKCTKIYYSGCMEKSNSYKDLETCIKICKPGEPVPSTMPPTPPPIYPEACGLPPLIGTCLGQIQRLYWNADMQRCNRFYYSGCDSNGNNFVLQTECMTICGGYRRPTPAPEVTMQPKIIEKEPCSVTPPKCSNKGSGKIWFYDKSSSKCQEYNLKKCDKKAYPKTYFDKKSKCETKCKKKKK